MKSFKSYAMENGYYKDLAQYMETDGSLSLIGEHIMINIGNVKLVETYMQQYKLDPFNHYAVLELSNTSGEKLILSGQPLSDTAVEYLFRNKRFQDIEKYINFQPLHSDGKFPQWEIALIQQAPEGLIKKYIQKYCLFDEAQVELMSVNRKDLIFADYFLISDFLEKYTPCMNACLKLVERGSESLIQKAFNKTPFHQSGQYAAAEIKLIELGNSNLFKEYVAKYDVFDEAIELLLEAGREEMLEQYLTYHALRKYEHRVALSRKKNPRLMQLAIKYVPMHLEGCYPEAEINMLWLKHKGLIYEYIEKWNLFEEAAERLIKFHDFHLTRAYISKYPLYGAALLELAIENNPETIALYCQKHISARCEGQPTAAFLIHNAPNFMGQGVLLEQNIKKLIRSGNVELIEAYVSSPHHISLSNSEVMFLEMGYYNLIINYIRRHGLHSEQAMLWMFEHQKYNFIKAHMAQPLLGQALVKLVELQNDDLISEYISHYPLRNKREHAQAEVLFMKYKNQTLVKSYIAKHGLYDESIAELFNMKNKALLKVLIDNYELGQEGIMQLLSSKMPDLCLAYVKKHKIDPYFHDWAVRTQNEKFIGLLMQDNPLSFRAFNELAVRKLFALMKEHVKKYGFPKKDVCNGSPYFYPLQTELDFVACGDKEMIRKYVSSYLLTPQGEDKLAALGDMSLVQHYLTCKKKLEAHND